MNKTTSTVHWTDERQRWTQFYAERLSAQLSRAAVLAADNAPQDLRPHFDSFLSLLNATVGRAELAHLWLKLVEQLHPLPVRWGQWAAWLVVLRQASRKAAELHRPGQQAEYLAYTADLLLNVGQLTVALESAEEAMHLARQSKAAWPLKVAGSAASATLRSMARYEDAQTLLDQVRAEAAQLEAPQPVARAAMATALLDLEQMDLLRYFKRLDDALALSETLINNLSTIEGIDPHDLATVYLRRATITWVSGRYDQAEEDLHHAAALFRQAGDMLQAVFAEGNLGLVYYSMSHYQQAEALMLEAIRAAEEINARFRLVSDLGDLSVVYIALGRMELAYDYASRMVALAEELGNTAELSRGRGNRGYALLGLGRYDEAYEDIEYSLNLYRQQGRLEGTIVTMIDLIIYLQGIGREEEAAQLAQENYEAAWKEDFPHLHIVTARCLALFQSPPEQRKLLSQALSLARQHNRPMDEAGCLFSLAAIADNEQEVNELYRQGVELLRRMGCLGWLEDKSPADPPLLPMTI